MDFIRKIRGWRVSTYAHIKLPNERLYTSMSVVHIDECDTDEFVSKMEKVKQKIICRSRLKSYLPENC